MRILLVVLLLASALGACHAPAAAQLAPAPEPETVLRAWLEARTAALAELPSEYRAWWQDLLARCGGPCATTVQVDEIRFHVHPGRDFANPLEPRRRARGAWLGGLVIVLADLRRWDRRVVQHEMLHLILNLPGESGTHPPIFARLGLLN